MADYCTTAFIHVHYIVADEEILLPKLSKILRATIERNFGFLSPLNGFEKLS